MPSILTKAFRIDAATWIKNQDIFLAWGTGLASWGTTPPVGSVDDLALVTEVGRRKVTQKQFVNPDPTNGTIILRNGTKWTVTTTPTHHILYTVTFEPSEAPTAVIREWGLFKGTTTQAGLPAGQTYFTPAQVTNIGRPIILVREVFTRQPLIRELFQFVQTV
jgi:hypothetical protein